MRAPQASGSTPSASSSFYVRTLLTARTWVDLEDSSLKKAMVAAAPHASGRLLDVGCGDKPYEALFTPHVTEYVGAEYTSTYETSANASKHKADVLYSGETLPFEDGSFDTVLCNQVAEHVPEPAPFIADIIRVLKVGGKLIVTVPFSYRIHSAPHDFHRFTRFALEHYAAKHNVRVDLIQPRGGFWSVVGQKFCAKIALRGARLGGEIQKAGALGYEKSMNQKPRYWAMPLAATAILGISTTVRMLDAIDPDDSETLGYMLLGTKMG